MLDKILVNVINKCANIIEINNIFTIFATKLHKSYENYYYVDSAADDVQHNADAGSAA